jgi:hypothetical protein
MQKEFLPEQSIEGFGRIRANIKNILSDKGEDGSWQR